jgi:hypothetical protein
MQRLMERIRAISDIRLLRLITCGFARTLEPSFSKRLLQAVEMSERFADGLATRAELEEASAVEILDRAAAWAGRAAWVRAEVIAGTVPDIGGQWSPESLLEQTAERFAATEAATRTDWEETIAQLHSILDCISPATAAIATCPSHIQGLVNTIYNNRDWALMPLLADALEENGYEEMAQHCRQPVHAKGCWVLDGILLKR